MRVCGNADSGPNVIEERTMNKKVIIINILVTLILLVVSSSCRVRVPE
jgi:hypothetical protein